jgi:nucleoside phosphorylase
MNFTTGTSEQITAILCTTILLGSVALLLQDLTAVFAKHCIVSGGSGGGSRRSGYTVIAPAVQ